MSAALRIPHSVRNHGCSRNALDVEHVGRATISSRVRCKMEDGQRWLVRKLGSPMPSALIPETG
jgi:hypothetical protein